MKKQIDRDIAKKILDESLSMGDKINRFVQSQATTLCERDDINTDEYIAIITNALATSCHVFFCVEPNLYKPIRKQFNKFLDMQRSITPSLKGKKEDKTCKKQVKKKSKKK
jgi:hypothetical protein